MVEGPCVLGDDGKFMLSLLDRKPVCRTFEQIDGRCGMERENLDFDMGGQARICLIEDKHDHE